MRFLVGRCSMVWGRGRDGGMSDDDDDDDARIIDVGRQGVVLGGESDGFLPAKSTS